MKLNQLGLDLIRQFEGCKLKAYPDPATGSEPITIGFGHTELGLKLGTVWTQEQADKALAEDLAVFERFLNDKITNVVNSNQFSACVSLCYNIGCHNFLNSTLLKLINQGKLKQASEQFVRWNKAAGKVMKGLTTRREAEAKLFMKED